MKVLSKLQLWTTPLWLILMVIPFVVPAGQPPRDSINTFFAYQGEDGNGATNLGSIMLAAGVCLSLIAQIAEQIDYLRFMPPRTRGELPSLVDARWSWPVRAGSSSARSSRSSACSWPSTSSPTWPTARRSRTSRCTSSWRSTATSCRSPVALALAVILVVISQVKINVTNAYSGSLAWTNSFTRVTKRYPGRVVFLAVNLLIALILMEANMFDFLNTILGFYANCGMSWIVVVASDITINKYLLKLSPKQPEFRRGMLYAINPVGFGSMLISAGVSIAAFFGLLGTAIQPYSPLVAIGLALVLPPIIAFATQGRYYLRRTDDGIDLPMYDENGNPSDAVLTCHVCRQEFERPDMVACATHDDVICSLCLSTDKLKDHVLPAQ